MSKFKRRPDGTTYRKRNPINEQFSPRTLAMLESPAYRVMSLAAHRVIARIEIELCHHGGNDNGPECGSTASGRKSVPLSISRVRERSERASNARDDEAA